MSAPLIDQFGRVHTYLRVSVTDRCNMRCVYCMPPDGMSWTPRENLLSYEEIGTLLAVFARMGVRKVRITGGEPTVRADIHKIIGYAAATPGIDDIAMTTNALHLERLAPRLAGAGLKRINVSLDSLRPDRFKALTRGGDLSRVLRGIDAAIAHGIRPVKINAVLLEGHNEDELFELVEFFGQRSEDIELRFIEYMPFMQRRFTPVPSAVSRARLRERYTMVPALEPSGQAGPARSWQIAENGLKVGFISALSEQFCASCNRLRLQSDGHLRTCLAHEDTPSLRDLVRGGASDDQLERAIREMVRGKPEGHSCDVDGGQPFEGVMTSVGG